MFSKQIDSDGKAWGMRRREMECEANYLYPGSEAPLYPEFGEDVNILCGIARSETELLNVVSGFGAV